MTIKKTLGLRIKSRREYLGMSQVELARKLGYKTNSSITKIEGGLVDIPAYKVADFAKALDMEVAELLEGLIDQKYEHLAENFANEVLKVEPKTDNYLRPIMGLLIKMNDEQLKTTYNMLQAMYGGDYGNSNMV